MADDVLINKAATIERCVAQGGWIDAALFDKLKRMVGFATLPYMTIGAATTDFD